MKKIIIIVTGIMMFTSAALAKRERVHFEKRLEDSQRVWDETKKRQRQSIVNSRETALPAKIDLRHDTETKLD